MLETAKHSLFNLIRRMEKAKATAPVAKMADIERDLTRAKDFVPVLELIEKILAGGLSVTEQKDLEFKLNSQDSSRMAYLAMSHLEHRHQISRPREKFRVLSFDGIKDVYEKMAPIAQAGQEYLKTQNGEPAESNLVSRASETLIPGVELTSEILAVLSVSKKALSTESCTAALFLLRGMKAKPIQFAIASMIIADKIRSLVKQGRVSFYPGKDGFLMWSVSKSK